MLEKHETSSELKGLFAISVSSYALQTLEVLEDGDALMLARLGW